MKPLQLLSKFILTTLIFDDLFQRNEKDEKPSISLTNEICAEDTGSVIQPSEGLEKIGMGHSVRGVSIEDYEQYFFMDGSVK